ncbi:uncharacterized protein LOC106674076 [Cimex lectularius]|uniref:Uncharacterized protein n=1 Tax=Cimex lectularius TaxID=79782 RepID=A0A8I6SIG1_CIMLE|nr:uncharacterized protein LOC106674076 [Cimex lectularius]
MGLMKAILCSPMMNKTLKMWSTVVPSVCSFSLNSVHLKQEDSPGASSESVIDVQNFLPRSQCCSQVVCYLKKYGFTDERASNLIGVCPQIETLNLEKLDKSLLAWSNCQFGEQHFMKLLTDHPQLLLANYNRIEETYLFLLSKYNKKLVLSIFLTAPLVITDSVDRLSDKIDYLEKEMLVSKNEIAHSGALSYTIDYIRERFEFLIRAGVYKPLREKERQQKKFKNPRLDIILNTSDTEFSTNVAGLSLFEYEVFQDLMKDDYE